MKIPMFTFVYFASLFIYTSTYSQENWSMEFRPGVNFPISEEGIETGFGFELSVSYSFMPHLGAYAGWGWNQFPSDENFIISGKTYDLEETGYIFGLQFFHPLLYSFGLSYLVKVGGIYNHVELENSNGDIIEDSGHGLGWEAGVGLAIEVGRGWDIRPRIDYRSLTRKIEIETTSTDIKLNYIKAGVGIVKKF